MNTRTIATHLPLSLVCVTFLALSPSLRAGSAPPASAPTSAPASRPSGTQPSTPPSVGDLVSQLSSADWHERRHAAEALAALGPGVMAELQRIREDRKLDGEARAAVERIVGELRERQRVGATRVTLKGRALDAAHAFEGILAQGNLKLAPSAAALLKDAKPIDIDFDRVPVWEGVLDLCARAGVAFCSVDSGGAVVLVRPDAAHPAPPVAASGPFVMTIARVTTIVKHAQDFAAIRPTNGVMNNERGLEPCRIYLFAWAEPRLKTVRWYIDATDARPPDPAQAAALKVGRGSDFWGGTVNENREMSLTFEEMPEGMRRIKTLRISAHFALELEHQTLDIPDVLSVQNGWYDLAGYRLNLRGVHKMVEGRYGYEYSVFRDGRSPADWQMMQGMLNQHGGRLVDAKGNRLGMMGGSGSYSREEIKQTGTATVEAGRGIVAGEPARMMFDLPSKLEHRPATFEFTDVPLP